MVGDVRCPSCESQRAQGLEKVDTCWRYRANYRGQRIAAQTVLQDPCQLRIPVRYMLA